MSKFNLQIDGKIKSTTKGNVAWWYGGGAEAWGSLSNAKAGVPAAIRSGQVVGVLEDNKIVEYIWYPNDISDNGLVLKQDALPDNIAFTDIDNDFTENQTFKEATFERAFSQNEATANNELVRLDQLNSAVSGLNWQDPIDDIIDFTTNEPTSPTIGDRYINSANGTSSATGQGVTKNNIYEWDGSDWAEFPPVDGWTVFDRAVDQNFTFNGTSWVEFGSTVSHNNTTGLQGGQAGQYYHLTEAQYLAFSGGIDAATLNGQNGAYYLNYNNFTNVPDLSGFLVAADLSPYAKLSGGNEFSGNQTIIGTISANNLSGTNTGNETKASIDALGVDAATLQGQNGAYYLDYNNFSNKPTIDNYGYFQLQTNSINRKQIASQNILNFLNGFGIAVTYGSNGAVTISNSITNNNQLTNGAGYVTTSGNTIIGTDDDINTSGAQVIDTLVMTDGVITSHSLRNLTLANLGFTGDSNANRITNNNQISNGAGYITSAGNTQLSKEQVEDYVGLMVQNNIETNISVTYDDSTNKLNFVSVNTQLSDAQVKSITDPLYLGKTAKAVDSDKLDGQDSTYYLNYNNFSNTPDLGVYAKLSGGNTFSGNQTFISTISIACASGINGTSSGSSNISYLEFDESNGTTRQGYIGFGSNTNSDLYLKNDVSGKQLRLKDDGVLNYNGNATFLGDFEVNGVSSYPTFKMRASGLTSVFLAIGMTDSANHYISTSSPSTNLLFKTNNITALTLDSSQNAIFSGGVEVIGGGARFSKNANQGIINIRPLNGTFEDYNLQIEANAVEVGAVRMSMNGNIFLKTYGFNNVYGLSLGVNGNEDVLKLTSTNATFSGDVEVGGGLSFSGESGISEVDSSKLRYYGQKHIFQYESDYAEIEVGGIDLFVIEGGANASINYSFGTVDFDKPIKATGYKSSDGSEGISNQFFTGGNIITVKNGIITDITAQP